MNWSTKIGPNAPTPSLPPSSYLAISPSRSLKIVKVLCKSVQLLFAILKGTKKVNIGNKTGKTQPDSTGGRPIGYFKSVTEELNWGVQLS